MASTKARSHGRCEMLQVIPVDGNMEAVHTNTTSTFTFTYASDMFHYMFFIKHMHYRVGQ